MTRRIFIARPRTDCSFKQGPVPATIGLPLNRVRRLYEAFADGLEAYHRLCGDEVAVEHRPLWQFDLETMQRRSPEFDRVYFPHRLRTQFPIGPNAIYFKSSPFADYFTVDPVGWGASLSFLPTSGARQPASMDLMERLGERVRTNESVFDQPPQGGRPVPGAYHLFVCQLPHDETIRFHSDVGVEQALSTTIRYAEQRGLTLVVKGHPANLKSMAPLRARTEASSAAIWVDDHSIHTCLAYAQKVFLVNSGVGFEAFLHDRTVIRFGRAEYDEVTPRADPDVASLVALETHEHSLTDYADFLARFLSRCVHVGDPATYGPALEQACGSA